MFSANTHFWVAFVFFTIAWAFSFADQNVDGLICVGLMWSSLGFAKLSPTTK